MSMVPFNIELPEVALDDAKCIIAKGRSLSPKLYKYAEKNIIKCLSRLSKISKS